MKFPLFFSVAFSLSTAGFAMGAKPIIPNEQLQLGTPVTGGNSCLSQAPSSVQIDSDGSIHFSPVLAIESRDSELQRGSCTLAIPAVVPAGMRLALSLTSTVGDANVLRAQVDLRSEVFLAGGVGRVFSQDISDRRGSFSFSQDMGSVYSACGSDTIIRLNTSVVIKGAGTVTIGEQMIVAKLVPCQ